MVHQVLQRFRFQFSSPQPTPPSTNHSLSASPSDESIELSGPYPELVGCLMHRKVHWDAVKSSPPLVLYELGEYRCPPYLMVTTTTLGGLRVSICTCARKGCHLAMFTRRPGSSLYALATKPPQVAASARVSA
ncbi:unnamed protein product [Closterium sp. NIES-54]